MPTLSTNANNLIFTAPDQQWIVESGVVVGSPDVSTAVDMRHANDSLLNSGILFMPANVPLGGTAVTVRSGADGSSVVNTKSGSISGLSGISAVAAANVHVANAGSIVGFSGLGIDYGQGAGAELDNSGYIYGKNVGIRGTLLNGFTFTNSGVIESDGNAMTLLLTGGKALLTNTGKIKGGDGSFAIIVDSTGSGATVELINQGVIRGQIDLSRGADTFNGGGGVTKGVVFGGDGNDTLTGGGSDDELHGDNGQDTISGRGGEDILIGGAAGDTLKGLRAGDYFVYLDTSDSNGNSADTRDTIIDFDVGGGDRIDLRPLDAKVGGGNQKFDFIGTNAFSGQKGQLRYAIDDGNAIVQVDVTGDGKADMAILVSNVSKLSADDFFL